MPTIIFDFYNTLYNSKTGKLFYGVYSLLKLLKRSYKLVLISTGDNLRWQLFLQLRLNEFFDELILCQEKTVNLFSGYAANNTLVIGDRLEVEINLGKLLGCQTLLVKPFEQNPVTSIKRLLKL